MVSCTTAEGRDCCRALDPWVTRLRADPFVERFVAARFVFFDALRPTAFLRGFERTLPRFILLFRAVLFRRVSIVAAFRLKPCSMV
jgi:hypothetical protein